jgi:hypothetical protein
MKFHIRQIVEPDGALDDAALLARLGELVEYERRKLGTGVVGDSARATLKEAADLVANAIAMKEDRE